MARTIKEKVFFFRPGVDLNNIVIDDDGRMNEKIRIQGKDYVTFGNGKWTALKEYKPEKVSKTAKRAQ